MGENLCQIYFVTELMTTVHKELKNLNTKKTNNSIKKKWVVGINTTLKEKIRMVNEH